MNNEIANKINEKNHIIHSLDDVFTRSHNGEQAGARDVKLDATCGEVESCDGWCTATTHGHTGGCGASMCSECSERYVQKGSNGRETIHSWALSIAGKPFLVRSGDCLGLREREHVVHRKSRLP